MIFIDCCDVTASMGQACIANRETIYELKAAYGVINNGYENGKIACVGDYDNATLANKFGGVSICNYSDDINTWLEKYMKPRGGGGYPEAYKTFFNIINEEFGTQACTKLVFLYCDALPHGNECGLKIDYEGRKEEIFIKNNNMIQNWDELCSELKKNNFKIFIFLTINDKSLIEIYSKLGNVIVVKNNTSENIIAAKLKVFYENINITEIKDNPDIIINCFHNFLSSKGGIMSLISSPVLGKFWRQKICSKYLYLDDGKYKKDCQDLMNMLSNKAAKLTGDDKDFMKKWIEDSYDMKEEILNILGKIVDKDSCDYIIIPDSDKGKVNIDDILELGRGGKFTVLGKLIQNLVLVSSETKKSAQFIPLSSHILDKDLFRLIANLLVDGMMFSVNVSYIVAILSINNKYIKDRAIKYLTENKGKWIDWSFDKESGSPNNPTFWSANFFRVLKLVSNDVDILTSEEKIFRDKFLDIANIKVIKNINLELTVPVNFDKPRLDVTWKIPCVKGSLNHSRCFTVTNGETKSCYICDYNVNKNEDYDDKTYWAQCRTCCCMYGITSIRDLNVDPKCHYCRNNIKHEVVTCESCLLDFASPNKSHMLVSKSFLKENGKSFLKENDFSLKENGAFKCPLCVKDSSSMKKQINVKLIDLMKENSSLLNLIPYKINDDNTKLWKCVINAIENKNTFTKTQLFYNKFRIHNIDEIVNKIKDSIAKYDHYETCSMCIEDVPIGKMTKACGNCQNRICTTCVESWYSQVKLGEIINETNIKCPFCKCMPKFSIIKNLDIAVLKNIRKTKNNKGNICNWDKNFVFASCIKCLNVKPALEKVCANTEEVEINNWKCDECRTLVVGDNYTADNKKCYNCGIMVEKTGGCNHITCICKSHWCWTCENGFSIGEIYDHMAKCGGIFAYDVGYESLDDN